MKFNLLEDNKNVEKLKNHLDKKVIELRRSNKDEELFKEISEIYNNIIDPWVDDYYLHNVEISEKEEENLINEILDLTNVINKILGENLNEIQIGIPLKENLEDIFALKNHLDNKISKVDPKIQNKEIFQKILKLYKNIDWDKVKKGNINEEKLRDLILDFTNLINKAEKQYLNPFFKTFFKEENLQEAAQQITPLEAEDKIQNSKGALFTVTFTKQDGSSRVLNGRLGVKKFLKGGTLRYDAKEKGYISVFDIQISEYRMINKNTITALKIGGQEYTVVKPEPLQEIKIDPYPIKVWHAEKELYGGRINGHPFSFIKEDNEFILICYDSYDSRDIEIVELFLENNNIKYRTRWIDEDEIEYWIPSRYVEVVQELYEIRIDESKQEIKNLDYYQKLLNLSRLDPNKRKYIQRVINTIKSSGNFASSNQLLILAKFKSGQI